MNRSFRLQFALLVAVSAATAAGAAETKPAAADLKLAGPKYVHADVAKFEVTAPADMEGRTVRIDVEGPGGRKAGGSARLEAPRSGFRREAPKEARGSATLDASKWADGQYTARMELDAATTSTAPATQPATQPVRPQAEKPSVTFRVIRAQLRKAFADDSLRGEMGVWLDHVNEWNGNEKMKPSWRNAEIAVEKPALLYAGLRGVLLRSYFNPQLDRLQPYSVYVPKAYDPNKPMALMILLHGSGFDYLNILSDIKAGQEFEDNPMLVANAGAFRHQEFRHMALNDVLWVLEDMRRKYNVDADRVCLQGISLGGRGSVEVPALRPEVWAAASPQGSYGVLQETSDPAYFAEAPLLGRWMAARWDIRSYLPNVRHVPMQFVAGWKDVTTPVLNATTLRHLINKRFGGKAELLGFDTGHNISMPQYKWSDTRAWMLKQKRVHDPLVVTARTSTLRYNRFYWVTVDQMQHHWKMAQVQARIDEQSGSLSVETENVTEMTLEPPRKVQRIEIDGNQMAVPSRLASLRFTKADGKWKPVESPATQPGNVKRHGVSGPIWDVCNGRCIAVYGTRCGGEETRRLKEMARHLAYLDCAWGEPSLPVVSDADVSDEQKKTCNLLLVGDARTNSLLAGQAWPFDLEAVGAGKGLTVLGATHDKPSDLLHFIHPSPYGKDTCVYVTTPLGPGGAGGRPWVLSPTESWDIGIWTDWIIRGMETAPTSRSGDPPARRLRAKTHNAGVFDSRWKLVPPEGTLFQPSPMNWE
jgi:poly(3-hydroxybutyrate) depolymerase